jgi:hypothetical protein
MTSLLVALLLSHSVIYDESTYLGMPSQLRFTGAGIECSRGSGIVTCLLNGTASTVPWTGVTGKPSTFTPAAHTHTGADITTPVAEAETIEGVWIGPDAPVDPVTYATWLTNGHVGHWGWIDTTP